MTDTPSLFCIDCIRSNSNSHSTCLYSVLDIMLLPRRSHLINLLTPRHKSIWRSGDPAAFGQGVQKSFPQTTSAYKWLRRSGWFRARWGHLVKTEPPTLTSHFPRDSKITMDGFTTAGICLLANRKLSKSIAHAWANLLGGPRRKIMCYGHPANFTSVI